MRGLLILIHLCAVLAAAFPVLVDERGMDKKKWQHPSAQREFATWTTRINYLGFDLTQEKFEDGLWNVCHALNRFHALVKRPFDWYYQYVGIKQNWRMFPAPVLEPSRLQIDVRENGVWRTVYRLGSRENDWLVKQLEHDRVQAALNLYRWNLYPEAHEGLVDWVAAQVAQDFPTAEKLRWRWIQFRILTPGEVIESGHGPDLETQMERLKKLARYHEERRL